MDSHRKPPAPDLWSSLDSGLGEIERMLLRADQGVAAVGLVIAGYAAAFLSAPLGLALGVLCLVSLAWFTVMHAWHVRGGGGPLLRGLVPVTEVTIPGLALVLIVAVQGPAYALGSWVPPQLFSLFIAMQVLRLRPAAPLLVSALAALEYGVVYAVAIQGQVPADELLFRPVTQATRVSALLLTGGACSLAVMGLRTAIARATADARAHDLFGKYRLGQEIASGGMGRVMQAMYCPEGGFERRVAVKLIHPHLARDAAFLERFRHEASLVARLAHPNIVAALDFGVVDGQYFFAMEFVDGPTLATLLEHRHRIGRPLDPRLVIHVGQRIAEALHFAHAVALDDNGRPLRVIHRDLSPSNVLVDRSGVVKISDFGVARALGDTHSLHTRTLAGKPSYLAPEQLRDNVTDERSDLFSLAVTLWEMCANTRLFTRDSESATLFAVVRDEAPQITEVRPELGPHWDVFFTRALGKDRAQRFQSAAEVLSALDLLEGHDGTAHPEDVAALVRSWADVPELDLDEDTPPAA